MLVLRGAPVRGRAFEHIFWFKMGTDGGRRRGGREGGINDTIQTATMPKTLAFTAFARMLGVSGTRSLL